MVPGEGSHPATEAALWAAGAGPRAVCLQSTLLVTVGLMSAAALVLLVFGACSLAARADSRDTAALLGTMIGGGLLLLMCGILLVVVCLWTGRCWLTSVPQPQPPPSPSTQRHVMNGPPPAIHGPSPPRIRLESAPSAFPPTIYAKEVEVKEMRYLTPTVYKERSNTVGKYAPLAQHEELTPSLRSSFQSVEDL